MLRRAAICSALLTLCLLPIASQAAKTAFKPNIGPDLPTITVTCGDVSLVLRQASQWTPARIDYKGKAMTTERSAYGTVFSFPGVGFIGTGHLENEPEPLTSLAFILDGKPVDNPAAEMKGGTFKFKRVSQVRNFSLTCTWEIRDNRLYETSTVHTDTEQPLMLVYHFMHAWVPTVSAFAAGKDATPGQLISGELTNGEDVMRKFYVNQKVDWFAVYEPGSQQHAVSRLLESPVQGGHVTMVWNVVGTYRKYYLKCFENSTVPAGFTGTWKMVTAFGAGDEAGWQERVQKQALELKP